MNLENIENRTTREKSATIGNIVKESSNTQDTLKRDDSVGLLKTVEFHCNLKPMEHIVCEPDLEENYRNIDVRKHLCINFFEVIHTYA